MKKFISLIKKYLKYTNDLYVKNEEQHNKFIDWLKKYINYKRNERVFNPTYLPKYEQGQIIFVDLGCGINREFSYPHYAIVLNTEDRKKNDLITVVPVTSKKDKHSKLKPWEHEIRYPFQALLTDKIHKNFDIYTKDYERLRNKVINLYNDLDKLNPEETDEQYNKLIHEGVKEIYKNNTDIIKFIEKMKNGSIVEINQVRTISKARILFPKNKKHALFDVKVRPYDLDIIKYKLINHMIKDVSTTKNIDTESQENV